MVSFAAADWAVVALFAFGVLALGFSARLRESSALQYIAAGRSLTLPAFVATLVSTWYGGILGIGESVQLYGLGTWLLLGVPYYFFGLVYALYYARRVRAALQISIPERMEARFGKSASLVAALLVFLLGVPAVHVLMLGVLARAFTGWPITVSIIVGTVFGAVFLVKGGLLADVRVSMLAFATMYVGFAAIALVSILRQPPGEMMRAVSAIQPALTRFDGGQSWITIASFFVLGAWTLIDPGFHQRAASAASPEVGRRGVLVSVFFWVVFDLLTITTGLYALANLGESGVASLDADPAGKLLLFPVFGDRILASGLKGLFFCGMLGTIISAMVGYALVSGATLGRDVVARLAGFAEGPRVVRACRWGVVVSCAVAVILARSLESVVSLWYAWGGAVIGALLLPVSRAYGLLRLGGGAAWITLSMVLSFGMSFAWLVWGNLSGNPYLEAQTPWGTLPLGTLAPGLAISAVVLTIGSLLGARTSDDRRRETDDSD